MKEAPAGDSGLSGADKIGEVAPPPPRREAPKFTEGGTFGTSLFEKLRQVGVAVNKNPEPIPASATVASSETTGEFEAPQKKQLETTGDVVVRRAGVDIGRFTPHEPKNSSPDSPNLLSPQEEETMSGLVEQVLNDSLDSIAPKTTEASLSAEHGRPSRQSELGQALPKVDPAVGHHEMLSFAQTRKLEREGMIDPRKNDVRMPTSFMTQDPDQYNKQEAGVIDRGSQGMVEVVKGKVEDDPQNKNRFRVSPIEAQTQVVAPAEAGEVSLVTNPETVGPNELIFSSLDGKTTMTREDLKNLVAHLEATSPSLASGGVEGNLSVGTNVPQPEAVEEINPYNFPDRMLSLDDYSVPDDPNFPQRFNGESPTNPELQVEIAKRREAWKAWKKAQQQAPVVSSSATTVAGIPVIGSIHDVPRVSEEIGETPSEAGAAGNNAEINPSVAHIPYPLRSPGAAGTMPASSESDSGRAEILSPLRTTEVSSTPPSTTEAPAPYSPEDLAAYVAKERSPAQNPIYSEEDLRAMTGAGGAQTPEGGVPQGSTPETPPDPFEGVAPEARRQTREMLYKMQKGISEIDPKDQEFLEFRPTASVELAALEVHKNRTDLLDRFKSKAAAGKKLKKSGGTEGAAEFAEAEIWHDNANTAFESSMDGLKREMLLDFLKKKKEAYPKLTQKQLEKEALQYSSRFVLEAAQNQYQQVATAETAIIDEQEKGRLRRMLETYAKWPKGRRVILSAALGAGTATGAALLFGAGGIVVAASYGAYRGARALVGGGLGAGINELIERGYTKKKYGKERGEAREAQWAETEANLASQLQEGEDWIHDQEKLLSLMTIVDSDAKKYQEKLEGIAAKEQRTRTKAAIVAGLAGGVIANIDNIYGVARGLFSGGKETVASAVSVPGRSGTRGSMVEGPFTDPSKALVRVGDKVDMVDPLTHAKSSLTIERVSSMDGVYTGEPLKVGTADAFTTSPEALGKLAEVKDMATVTVPRGSSLWEISRSFEKRGLITHDQWAEAWQNSTNVVMKNGVPTEVPFSETGLIHAGDQVIMVKDAAGHVRFQALDLVKDKLPMGDNQMYYDFLQKGGKPVPQWLENAVHAKAPTPIEHANHVLGVGRGHEGTIAAFSADAAHPLTSGEALYSAFDQERVMEEFTHQSLLHQELSLQHMDSQREILMNSFSHAQNSQEAAAWSEQLKNLESIRSHMALAPEYLQNLQNLRTELLNHGVKLDLVEKLGGMKVKDFMAIADFETLRGVPGSRMGEAESLAMMLRDMRPGKIERNMSVLEFLKSATSQ